MSAPKMTPAEVLAVMDAAIDEADSVSVMPLTKARAAVAALVAERDEYKREAAAQLQEMEDMHTLIMRQGDLLTGVVNAIRGEPAELCRHSHHNAPELAANVVAERDGLQVGHDALLTVRETLKRECEALKAERDALREALRQCLPQMHKNFPCSDKDAAFKQGRAALAGDGHE